MANKKSKFQQLIENQKRNKLMQRMTWHIALNDIPAERWASEDKKELIAEAQEAQTGTIRPEAA